MKYTTNLDLSIKRYRAFYIKYLPATDHRCSRVQITDLKSKHWVDRKTDKIALNFNSDYHSAENQALNFLNSIGIKITGVALAFDSIFLSENFTTKLSLTPPKNEKHTKQIRTKSSTSQECTRTQS